VLRLIVLRTLHAGLESLAFATDLLLQETSRILEEETTSGKDVDALRFRIAQLEGEIRELKRP
jgi:hypothetical protein